jgi:hypothetical protein
LPNRPDPAFEPARPVIPAFTRQPFDIAELQPLLTDPLMRRVPWRGGAWALLSERVAVLSSH